VLQILNDWRTCFSALAKILRNVSSKACPRPGRAGFLEKDRAPVDFEHLFGLRKNKHMAMRTGHELISDPGDSDVFAVNIIAFLFVYIFGIGALMYALTTWFGLGDVGWELYWPMWCVAYAPIAVSAIVVAWRSRLRRWNRVILLWLFLQVTLTTLVFSLFLDIDWPVLVVEWFALPFAFAMLARLAKWVQARVDSSSGRAPEYDGG
jgi:hypothetical protein